MIISKHIIRSSIYINKYILIVKNNSKLLAIYQIIKNFDCSFVVQGYSMEMITIVARRCIASTWPLHAVG
ncbi:hypothetical protein RHHCN13_08055 [Rickettsia conorii subsp. heilongjiangensis]|uniref:Uncharacterized protein n=1 Tax=Rickettsia conorii subsp. heilongjiangensis TaxID=226665 RepID=A0AAD1LSZ7_RICCR|nr:hypothetical protein [Rickettsia conorii]BBM91757.1 hypothetical protein RHCH81_08055 [Rickettsia conorii subsp. heilongjiangensis]BBM92966.1 hypothetical protein RHHCN13_08055 [Rickettsia conorii subsp. heilongjiangensis]BBM94175.1 hypothetical protein RHSENDAI29_08055 [Rickettsia conorii subsp. heilongjiangensis]BBM95384.1 hypothetical protein RHSENDAI58_08055 [Rickettsia conorii subsp. heilongjiangensis]